MARRGLLVLAALGVLTLAVPAGLLVGSAWRVRTLVEVPAAVRVPPRGDAVEGGRLAWILGCRGCHDADLGGRECYDVPGRFRLTCPNVTEAREDYDDVALVTLLRHGRKRNGALVDFMPWDMYNHLTDEDLGHLIAFVRETPAVVRPEPLPASWYSWAMRWEMVKGEYPYLNDLADYDSTPLEGIAEKGRYLAAVSCPECHAPDLRGYEGDTAPDLLVAKGYTLDGFVRLMAEGITMGGTESTTGLMTETARLRFSHFTPDEVAALKAYLDARPPS
jgi:mono/diheme cytochrome c family protein